MHYRSRYLALPAVAVLLGACATAPPVERSPESRRALEERMEATLVEKLGPDASTIRVALNGDEAVLLGAVAERATEELASEVAMSLPGIRSVDNKLALKSVSGNIAERAVQATEHEAEDAALESEVKLTLARDVGAWAGRIEVEAVDGVVSLRGTVPDTLRRDLALQSAKGVGGVRRVIDLINVAP